MSQGAALKTSTHVVDILGNVIGRDQPIMLMEKAVEMVSILGKENLKSDDVAFFDPFSKAGEILLACAFARCWARSEGGTKLLDVTHVQRELYESNRYFALAPDERHHRLSLRTFLGNTHSHNEQYNHIIRDGHYLSETDGRLDREKFEREFKAMLEYVKATSGKKKIIAVGNPPYQENDGGAQASAKPIYNYFVEALMDSGVVSEFILVIPARWFSVGKGLNEFRARIMASSQIQNLAYFERSEDVFPTVHVQGGICFLNWKGSYDGETQFRYKSESYGMKLSQFDIIPDDPCAAPIINKIISGHAGGKFVSSVAWSRKPFGLPTNYFASNQTCAQGSDDAVKCYVKGKKVKYLKRSKIRINADKIDEWKVAIPGAYATGARRCTLPKHQIFLIEKGAICTETYNVISSFKSKVEAERLIAYLQTDFCRYLLGLRKLTQHIPRDRWAWVPLLGLDSDISEEALHKKFKLTAQEVTHIKKKVEEWS